MNLYLKAAQEDNETVKSEAKIESVISQESQTQTVVQEPTRPQSSPPRLPPPGILLSHPTTKAVQLFQESDCSSARVIAQAPPEGVHTSQLVHLIHQPPTDHVFHPIADQSVQSIQASSSAHDSSIICVSGNPSQAYDFSNAVFLDRISKNDKSFKENEPRHNMKHYIDDPNYQVLEGSTPKTVSTHIPLVFNNNIHPMPKEVVYVPSIKPVPLQREDTLGKKKQTVKFVPF